MNSLSQKLAAQLAVVADARGLVVALSGGADSVVLLHALGTIRDALSPAWQLRALHINHGLHEDAAGWEQFCAQLCKEQGIAFSARRVRVSERGSVEAAARSARYEAFGEDLAADEVLLSAHHRDDQVETMLLRLLRGAGPGGLAGMPALRTLGRGKMLRPLLLCTRAEILDYVESEDLAWMQDPSNLDINLDRNYCRLEVLPRIESRWPGYRESWLKTQTLLEESQQLMADLAAIDLAAIAVDDGAGLALEKLRKLSAPRQRNLLRLWLQTLAVDDPGWQHLQQLVAEVIPAAADSNARVEIGAVSICSARGSLQALALSARQLQEPLEPPVRPWDAGAVNALSLPANGRLCSEPAEGAGLRPEAAAALTVRYRQGGETVRLAGRRSRSLKKVLQESDLPSWLRSRLPLLFVGDELACIPGVGVSETFAAASGEAGVVIHWQAPDFLLRPRPDSQPHET